MLLTHPPTRGGGWSAQVRILGRFLERFLSQKAYFFRRAPSARGEAPKPRLRRSFLFWAASRPIPYFLGRCAAHSLYFAASRPIPYFADPPPHPGGRVCTSASVHYKEWIPYGGGKSEGSCVLALRNFARRQVSYYLHLEVIEL